MKGSSNPSLSSSTENDTSRLLSKKISFSQTPGIELFRKVMMNRSNEQIKENRMNNVSVSPCKLDTRTYFMNLQIIKIFSTLKPKKNNNNF